MDDVQILTEARNKVADRWIQGRDTDSIGGFCSIGAVRSAHMNYWVREHGSLPEVIAEQMGFNADQERVALHLNYAIRELYPEYEGYGEDTSIIPDWNDADGRTQEQVLEMFDRALKIVERDG